MLLMPGRPIKYKGGEIAKCGVASLIVFTTIKSESSLDFVHFPE